MTTGTTANLFYSGSLANFFGTVNILPGGAADAVVVESAPPLSLPAGATLNVASGATIDLNYGDLTVAANVVINGPGASADFGAIRLDGANVSGNVLLAGTGNQIGTGAATFISTVSGVISGNDLNIWGAPGGTGSGIALTGQNTYAGPTTLSYGILRAGSAENPGVNGPMGTSAASNPGNIIFNAVGTENGGTLQYSSANQFDYSGRFSTTAGQAYNIDVNGQTVTFATPLSSAGGTLTLADSHGGGKLILSVANTYNGITTVNSGTLDIAANASIAGNAMVNGGTLELDNASALPAVALLTLASTPAAGAVNLNFSGTQNIYALFFGTNAAAVGTWGAPGSGAANTSAAFTGTGILNIGNSHPPYYYFDPNGNAAGSQNGLNGGGSGSWDSITSDWWITGSSDIVWAANGLAFFEGTPGYVTLNANETANGLIFAVDGYYIYPNNAQVLTLGGGAPTITVPNGGTSTTISCSIAGSAGLTQTGAGTLILSAATSTYTGGTTVGAGGTLEISSVTGAGASTGTIALSSNASLMFTAPGQCTFPYPLTGSNNSVFDINMPLFGNVYLTGSYIGFNGTIYVSGGNGDGAAVVEAGGPLNLSSTATWDIASGATVDLNYDGLADVANVIINGPGGSGNFGALRLDGCSQAGNIVLAGTGNQIGSGSAGRFVATVSGTISGNDLNIWGNSGGLGDTIALTSQNTYAGPTTLSYCNLRVGSAENPGVSGPLGISAASNPGNILFNAVGTVNGGTLQYSSANQFDYSGRFSTAANQAYNIDVNGQTVTFATPLSSSDGALTLTNSTGEGELILTASNTFSGGVTVNGGTLDVSTGNIQNNSSVTVNGGTLELDNPVALSANATLTIASNATVNLTYPGVQYISEMIVDGNYVVNGLYGARATNAGNVFTGPGAIAIGLTPPASPPINISTATLAGSLFTVSWSSVANGYYNVFTTTNLNQPWTLVNTNLISSQGSVTSFTLTNINTNGQIFVVIQQ